MASSVPDPTSRSTNASRAATFAEKRPEQSGEPDPPTFLTSPEEAKALASQWRMFGWLATAVAVLTAPVFFLLLYQLTSIRRSIAIVAAILIVLAFRGLIDVLVRRMIKRPPLLVGNDPNLRAEDHVARRRHWFWRSRLRILFFLAALYGAIVVVIRAVYWLRGEGSWADALTALPDALPRDAGSWTTVLVVGISVPLGLLINTVLFIGPLVIVGIRQVKAYEPNEATWGVHLTDVRGQTQPKEEIRKVVDLWQSGEAFEHAGGKRERGLLLLGPPGTGKTMTAKAIATEVNAPFVSLPASSVSQAFIGVDVLVMLYLGRRARGLAQKWGGQCIVFLDELDAIGLRRASLGLDRSSALRSVHDICFHGPLGAITATGDLVLESPAWRERLFAARKSPPPPLYPAPIQGIANRMRGFLAPGLAGMGGSSALQSLLITMDGIGDPRPLDRSVRRHVNALLDILYIIPRKLGNMPLRLPPAKPRTDQIFFIGACNVPVEVLDPALTRPGRFGRHVQFRTPSKDDRKDIIDLYLGKVAHDPELDTDKRRDELARITFGHSPAMIEQVCSLALTHAHHDRRTYLSWADLLDAITTVEAGIETGLTYVPDEARAIAIHEAGHAVCGHMFMQGHTSTRLTIRPRGWSLGQHVMGQIDERYSIWRHEKFADLVWTLGAMAAEVVFYDETTTGVGGDVAAATDTAAAMVGLWGMAPKPPRVDDAAAADAVMARYEALGTRLMNRASVSSPLSPNPVTATLEDTAKRRLVAQFLGQAFTTAYWFVAHNKQGTERVANTLLEKREIYGDEVVNLLNSLNLTIPDVDPLDESQWPRI